MTSPVRSSNPPTTDRDHRWVIVLAGGDGTRLASLTRTGTGTVVPKQYCSFDGERSLLACAMARAAGLAPAAQILVVVAAQHEPHWRHEPGIGDPARLIVQPHNRGTAPGVLLPLATVLDRDPAAIVTLLPSDHFVADESGLAATLSIAQRIVTADAHRTILVGIDPDEAVPDYGWIVPDQSLSQAIDARTLSPVVRFAEKPEREEAARLWASGAVWNSFLLVARGSTLQTMVERLLPQLSAAFAHGAPHRSPLRTRRLYENLPSSDFSRDVLAASGPDLSVLVAPPCGWTDLGTPARVLQCMRRWPRRSSTTNRLVAVDLTERALAAAGPAALDPQRSLGQQAGGARAQ